MCGRFLGPEQVEMVGEFLDILHSGSSAAPGLHAGALSEIPCGSREREAVKRKRTYIIVKPYIVWCIYPYFLHINPE